MPCLQYLNKHKASCGVFVCDSWASCFYRS